MSDTPPTKNERYAIDARHVVISLVLLVLVVWSQYVLWFGQQGIVAWRHTSQQLDATKKEIEKVSARIEKRKREIILVKREATILEEVARRNLGLVYPDEIIFVFPDSSKDDKKKSTKDQDAPLQSE
ncbi:cell division protein FtsB [Magnetococcus marinus MC-1]|uniref:Cell division protein FtsB n=1 Tax=Magnetococcus marinus (strain ATCC BAA-1437 / JCM 17883 / MC-1) TaxID=156889 RepID=A0LE23_MAGMM|nr:septum formation initiator family protein [Magnetococcus marinus]ABK46216.1 cell division protein FtsB [Magnetococcus marinus MC-1]